MSDHMRIIRSSFSWLGTFALLVLVSLFACSKDESGRMAEEDGVETVTARDIIVRIVAGGSVHPEREIAVKSTVPGVLEDLKVEVGGQVQLGQAIAVVRILPDWGTVSAGQARLNKACISERAALDEYGRIERLCEQGLVPRVDSARAAEAYELAVEETRSARDALEVALSGTSHSTGGMGNVIKASAGGTVVDLPLREGSYVVANNNFSDGTTIAHVADLDHLVFTGVLDETQVGQVAVGMQATIIPASSRSETLVATVVYVGMLGRAEEGVVQFELRAQINGRDGVEIRPGTSATAQITVAERRGVLAIREEAIHTDSDTKESSVLVQDGTQEFSKRTVARGLSDGIYCEIVSGLRPGDRIRSEAR